MVRVTHPETDMPLSCSQSDSQPDMVNSQTVNSQRQPDSQQSETGAGRQCELPYMVGGASVTSVTAVGVCDRPAVLKFQVKLKFHEIS